LTTEEDNSFFNKPIEFIDTAGCSFDEEQNPETLSSFNVNEGNLLLKHLQELINWHSALDYTTSVDVGIISPYKEQVSWLKENIGSFEINPAKISELRIKTIDGFQGEECDIIYISLVRSNADQQIGFLSDLRRMNVAITRAKKKLVVIGDSATIGSNPFYKSFIEYCEVNGFYRSAWELI
ncbi:MAG: C-terminal helicase domain-containing protein, partial [Bacteroidia bacterium]